MSISERGLETPFAMENIGNSRCMEKRGTHSIVFSFNAASRVRLIVIINDFDFDNITTNVNP